MQHSPIVVLGYVSSGADNFNSEQNDCVKDRKDICLKPVPGNEIVASVKIKAVGVEFLPLPKKNKMIVTKSLNKLYYSLSISIKQLNYELEYRVIAWRGHNYHTWKSRGNNLIVVQYKSTSRSQLDGNPLHLHFENAKQPSFY